MTLIESLAISLAGCMLGTLVGATIGFFDGRVGHFAVRGAAIGSLLGFVIPLVLVVSVVNWNRFQAWRKQSRTSKHP